MDPGDADREELENRVAELEETVKKMLPDRRGVLKGLGAAAVGGAAVGASTGGASGQSGAAGRQGTPEEPNDMYAWDLDVQNGADFNGTDIENAGSVSTGEINNRHQIRNGDDPAEAINDADDGDLFEIEPGSYTVSNTIEPGVSVHLRAAGWAAKQRTAVTFLKEFDGDMFRVHQGSSVKGIKFDGNGANGYTGSGLVHDGVSISNQMLFDGITVHNFDGDCIRLEDPYWIIMRGVSARGYDVTADAAYHIADGSDHPSQCYHERCDFGDADVAIDFTTTHQKQAMLFDNCSIFKSGVGMRIAGDGPTESIIFDGYVFDLDGPVLLLDSLGDYQYFKFGGFIDRVCQNPSNISDLLTQTTDIGAVTQQSSRVNGGELVGTWRGSTTDHHLFAGFGDNSQHYHFNIPNVEDFKSLGNAEDGFISAHYDIQNLSNTDTAVSGTENEWKTVTYSESADRVRLTDLQQEREIYWFPRGAAPTVDSEAIYFDDGTNRSGPGWRYSDDGGSTWTDV